MAREKLMVVEDEGLVALDLRRRLETLGFEVVAQAATGEEAVRKALEVKPDLILMDIRLGKGMDGIEAAQEIHNSMMVPIIYVTANSDRGTLNRAKITGPHGYILKPFRDRELQIAIEMSLYRHKAEKAIGESCRWFEAMLQTVEEAVIANDKHGAVRFMNAAAERLTGWREKEAMGRPLTEVVGAGVVSTLGARDVEDRQLRLDTPLQGVEGSVTAYRDVTDMRKLERKLAQKHKMEAIGRLAGGIAHDFNNLLTAINGFASLLAAKLPSGDPLLPDVETILEAGERAASLTHQLLAFSRQQTLTLTDQDLGALARNMDKLLRRVLGEDIEILTVGDADLWKVKADAGQMEQVILNLAVNARDAMPGGGKLTLETRNARLEANALPPGEGAPAGRYVMLAVSDTGTGMDAEVQSHVFEPFFTTKAPGEGTGMGLATVYGIVKQSRGHISVYSVPGMGTTFKVYLPAAEEGAGAAGPEALAPAQEAPGGFETVLVVDDERVVQSFVRETLAGKGYHVIEAKEPEDALEAVRRHPGGIKLLITDVVMPRVGGPQLAERIRAIDPGIKVLFISGYADQAAVRAGFIREDADFLRKPFSPSELARRVRMALDGA